MSKGKKTGGRDFKPGQSGNPSGGPKKAASWRAILEEVAKEKHKIQNKTLTEKQLMAKILWKLGLEGNLRAIETIMNRMEGLPKQYIEQTGGIASMTEEECEALLEAAKNES